MARFKNPTIDRAKEAAVDRFLDSKSEFSPEAQARYDEIRGRRAGELQLWHQYNDTRKPQHLSPLLKSLQPLIKNEANQRLPGLGGAIPRPALEAQLLASAVKSIHTYKPDQGVALPTWIKSGFPRVNDFISQNRNEKYMPAADMKRYGAFQNVRNELIDELGRPPSHEEIRQRAPQWSEATIKKMQRGFGRELYTDLGGPDSISMDDPKATLSHRDAFHLHRSQMTPEQQRFGQLFFPEEGQKAPSIKNIAKALGVTNSRAYHLKSQVEGIVGPTLKRE